MGAIGFHDTEQQQICSGKKASGAELFPHLTGAL